MSQLSRNKYRSARTQHFHGIGEHFIYQLTWKLAANMVGKAGKFNVHHFNTWPRELMMLFDWDDEIDWGELHTIAGTRELILALARTLFYFVVVLHKSTARIN